MLAIERAAAAAAPIAKFAPDDITQAVGMIQEAFFKDLLMQARAVEARRHAQLNIFYQRGVAGRGHDAIGIIALIQHQPLEDRGPIDLDCHAFDADAAHAGIAGRAVNHGAGCIHQLNRQVIQMRIADSPELEPLVRHGQVQPRRQVIFGRAFCR